MKPPISLVLVTAETCQLACSGCPIGRTKRFDSTERMQSGLMSNETADAIITKAKKEAHVLSVCLYYFNEVLLLPNLIELVSITKKHKLYTFLSTNLNVFNRVPDLMALEPENIIVSISGWTDETYRRYHQNGNIEKVKAHMVKMAELRKPNTFLRLSWHDFHYNKHEQPLAREFAAKHGYCFTPYSLSLLPLERALARWQDGAKDPAEQDLAVSLQDARVLCWPRRFWNCQMQQQTVTVDAQGKVYNCSDRYNPTNLRGSFFDRSVREILAARRKDYDCLTCKAVGGHIYGAQEYTVPLTSVSRWLDIPYRGMRLQGVVQRMSPRFWRRTVESFYNRPQLDKS